MAFEYYIRSGQKMLRCGYTTGTCAAAAARAAAEALLTGVFPAQVTVETPAGVAVTVEPEACRRTADAAACARHAYQWFEDHCFDRTNGGVYWSCDALGRPLDTTKHTSTRLLPSTPCPPTTG